MQEVQMIYLGSSWIGLLKDKRVGQGRQQMHDDEQGAHNQHNSMRNNLQDKLVTQEVTNHKVAVSEGSSRWGMWRTFTSKHCMGCDTLPTFSSVSSD